MDSGAQIGTFKGKRAYLYAVAGRNRGETLGTAERMLIPDDLSIAPSGWEWCPMLQEPRGSHGAASIDGKVYAIAGGGMKSNLTSCEVYEEGESWRCAFLCACACVYLTPTHTQRKHNPEHAFMCVVNILAYSCHALLLFRISSPGISHECPVLMIVAASLHSQ